VQKDFLLSVEERKRAYNGRKLRDQHRSHTVEFEERERRFR